MDLLILVIITMIIVCLLATIAMMGIAHKTMQSMIEERRREFWYQTPTNNTGVARQAAEDLRGGQVVSGREDGRIHGFSIESPKPIEENTRVRKKKSISVKKKTVAERKREEELSGTPKLARMTPEEVAVHFNVKTGV